MTWNIARQDCCTLHCPFGRAMAASQPDKSVALGSVCYCSAPGSYSLRSWASLVITDPIHKTSNQWDSQQPLIEQTRATLLPHPFATYLFSVRGMTAELRLLAPSVMLGIVHHIVASHLISSQRFYRWTAGTRDEPAPPRSEKHSFPVLNHWCQFFAKHLPAALSSRSSPTPCFPRLSIKADQSLCFQPSQAFCLHFICR